MQGFLRAINKAVIDAVKDPIVALYTFFVAPLTTLNGLAELLVKAAPLTLIGIGLALGFRANVWNIGAEGQYTMGALAGGGLALWFFDSQSAFLLPAICYLYIVYYGFRGSRPVVVPAV